MRSNRVSLGFLFLFALTFANASGQEPVQVARLEPSSPGGASNLAEEYAQYALTNQGNWQSGRALFQNEEQTRCQICHRVGRYGGNIGPDLSRIGGKFDRPHLVEALLEPSQEIVEGYHVTNLALTSGHVISGVIKSESPRQLQLVDSQAEWHRVNADEIEERTTSPVSMMPAGLWKNLSKEQFTDLIAYLETLRPGGYSPGDRIAGAFVVEDGFVVNNVAAGISAAASLEVMPDGRILICEQTGNLRMVKDGQLLDEPVLTLPVARGRERGLLGVTVHPEFPNQPFIYTCHVLSRPYTHHRVSQWTLEGDRIDPDSEKVLLEGDDQRRLGGNDPSSAQGGGIHFGPDGCLYISIGDQTASRPARYMNSLLGKILRINPDGTIPEDNPYLDRTQGKYQSIWAIGCRNPYTFAVRQGKQGTELIVNDVGGNYEEVNMVRAGNDCGWPAYSHGPVRSQTIVSPIHYYRQSCICGAAIAPNDWPEGYRNKFFFADFVGGWIRTLDPDNPQNVTTFAQRLRRPVDLRFSADGQLYVLIRNAWVLDGRFQEGTGSLISVSPASEQVAERETTVTK